MSDYQPIDCGLHSQYELWILRAVPLDLAWQEADGSRSRAVLRPSDLVTRNGAEFLRMEDNSGKIVDIRLDRIRSAQPDVHT